MHYLCGQHALSSRARSRSDDQGPGRQSRRRRDAGRRRRLCDLDGEDLRRPCRRGRLRLRAGDPGQPARRHSDRPDRGPARGKRQGRQEGDRRFRGRGQERRRVGRDPDARCQHRRRVRPVRPYRAAFRHRGGRAGPARAGRLGRAPDRGRAVRIRPSGHRRAANPGPVDQARPRDGLLGRQPSGRARHRRRHSVAAARARRSRSWS